MSSELFTSGSVYPSCACTPGSSPTTENRTDIPGWCFSPDGKDCSFYRGCLEVRRSIEVGDISSKL